MEILTEEKFKEIPDGKIFATGVLPNSSEGLFMTDGGGELRWIAKKCHGYDWAIYCHWVNWTESEIASNGDKVTMKENIQKCVPCTEEMFKLYRY
jgi:hypothetical protein